MVKGKIAGCPYYCYSLPVGRKSMCKTQEDCELRALWRNSSCAGGQDLGMWLVSTHVRRLGFILKAVWNTEGYEAADDMVETSVE